MQGQRGAIGSLPETLNFEHGSSSSDADANDAFLNSMNQEGPNLTMWNMGQPSSSSGPNQPGPSHIEPISDRAWPALLKSYPEPHPYEPQPSMLSLGDHGAHNVTVNPPTYRGSSFSDPFGPSSDPFELDGPLSRKRKATELTAGESSSGAGNGEIPNSGQIMPRLRLGVGTVSNENPVVENTRRNVRLRISSSGQQDPLPANNNNNNNVQPNASSSYPALRLNPVDLRSPPAAETENPTSFPASLRIPALRRHLQSTSRWSRNSSSRPMRSSNIPANISDHPLFLQPNEIRSAAQTEVNWSLNGGNGGVAGNGGAASAVTGVVAGNGGSGHYPPRRLSEFLRRTLLSGGDSETGSGRNPIVFPAMPPAASSSQDLGIPAGVNNVPAGHHHHHHQAHSRSSVLVGRQLDAAFGFPYLSRSMAAGSEGRGRLVSEIRNVLDLMRRGEPLRLEDVMILDPSVLYGAADIHDRHRDMRLDIDNMSYEELLALEEQIGNVNTGLTEETILKHLKQKQYVTVTGQPDAEPCCVCQEEYKGGDDLGALECGHDFHHSCIKQWLLHKNLCPICKSTAFAAK